PRERKITAARESERRDVCLRESRELGGDVLGAEACGVDNFVRQELVTLSVGTQGLEHDAVGRDLTALDFRLEGEHGTLGLSIALEAQHQSVAVDNAGRRRVETGDTGELRLQTLRRRFVEQAEVMYAASRGRRLDLMKLGQLTLARRNDELAQALMTDGALGRIGIEPFAAFHAKTRLQAACRIVDAGMDDFRIA